LWESALKNALVDTYPCENTTVSFWGNGLESPYYTALENVPTYDITDLLGADAMNGCNDGTLVSLPKELTSPHSENGATLDEDMIALVGEPRPNNCVVPLTLWSYAVVHDRTAFPNATEPSTIDDFFNITKYPGKRGVHAWTPAVFEMALVADGVPANEVYTYAKANLTRAIERAKSRYATIKDHTVLWYSGETPFELIKNKQVVMSTTYSGRANANIIAGNTNLGLIMDSQVLEMQWLGIVNGTKNLAEAMRFLKHAARTSTHALIPKYIPYGVLLRSSLDFISKREPFYNTGVDVVPRMIGPSPTGRFRTVVADPGFWASNAERIGAEMPLSGALGA
jgi:putative spermidine/putrescine transport system substrate-binding protein